MKAVTVLGVDFPAGQCDIAIEMLLARANGKRIVRLPPPGSPDVKCSYRGDVRIIEIESKIVPSHDGTLVLNAIRRADIGVED